MKIKNGEIEFYSKWLLDNLSLAGKKSRMRMKFINILMDKYKEYQSDRNELIKEHSRKDDKGNLIVLEPDENGYGQVDIVDQEAFKHDAYELAVEEFVIEESEANKNMLWTLKECIEDCPIEWNGQQAVDYEILAKLFDGIYEYDRSVN